MMTRAPHRLGIALLLLGAWAASARTLGIDEAVVWALERHPELRTMQAEVEAAQARVDEAGALVHANPEVSAQLRAKEVAQPQAPAVHHLNSLVELSQRFEVAGQRGARLESARRQLDDAHNQLAARRSAVAADVRTAFGHALAAERLASLADESRQQAKLALETVEGHFAAGTVGRLELNAARVELGRFVREWALAEERRQGAMASLELLVAADEQVSVVGELDARLDEAVPALEALLSEALSGRAELTAARHRLEAADAEARLADRKAYPNLRVGAGWGLTEVGPLYQLTVGAELPVFNRNQAARGFASAQVVRAREGVGQLERQVHREVAVARRRLEMALEAARVYDGPVGEAVAESLDLATEAHRAGKISLFELMRLKRDLLEARRQRVLAQEELHAARARLDWALGRGPPSRGSR